MSYKLTPRFYYTLRFWSYLRLLLFQSCKSKEFSLAKSFFSFRNSRTGLRVLLNAISTSSLRVGVQAFTCHTVLQAIKKAGHEIVFLDIDNEFHIDLEVNKEKIRNLDVIIVTHTFGYPADIDSIKKIVGDCIIIEDCAHSFLAKYNDKYTGCLCDAAIYSTGLGKFPPVGVGGYCVVNKIKKFPLFNHEYCKIQNCGFWFSVIALFKVIAYSILMKFPFYGMVTYKLGKYLDSKVDFIGKFSFEESKNTSWANNIFYNSIELYQKILNQQKKNSAILEKLLNKNFVTIQHADYSMPNFYAFPLLLKNRDVIIDELLINNIEGGKHFGKCIEWCLEFGYILGECPNTERVIKEIITLPIHSGVRKKTLYKIAKIINENFKK